ncbi:MAG: FHA domain-containing protein [Thermoanaerobaculia bacterium]
MRARFADCVLDTGKRELLRDGTPVDLTPKAFALLQALVESHPAAMSKADLYELLWPGVFVETGNLHTLVAEVRSAVGDDVHQIIRTVHRFGYALAAEVFTEQAVAAVLFIGERQLPLRDGENIIGREVIGAPDVSRRHARISVKGQSISIEDLGSKNGTWVGGQRIESAKLEDGDVIILGRTRAVLRLVRNEVTVTASPPGERS